MEVRQPNLRDLIASPGCFLGLGFGSGLAPFAPGTFGTLAAVPLYLLCAGADRWVLWLVTAVSLVAGIWICGHTARYLGSHDHPAVVWDEIAGYFVTMLLVPATWINVVAGFLLFRLFDIVKPWPIKLADQHVEGGVGIMLDDLIAGVFAALLLWLINIYLL